MLIDTHCHLDGSLCPEGSDGALERAREAGVGAFVCIGVGSLAAAQHAVSLAETERDVVATVGIHPHEAQTAEPDLEAQLYELLARPSVVGVGEIGLDYHYDNSPRAVQLETFRRWVGFARSIRKPIIIHTREASQQTLEVLRDESARDVGGVIHCFSEDRAFAQQALDMNFDLSFSGIVTFKSAREIQDVATWAPPDRIMVETDSPFLAPVPMRGKRNEPANVVHTARFIAGLRGVSLEELSGTTTVNACRRFGAVLSAAVRLPQVT